MFSSQWENRTGADMEFDIGHDIWTPPDWPTAPRYTARSPSLWKELFRIETFRQNLYANLGALDVARLLQAVDEEGLAGPRERAKYLNPMRDLFTDNELLKLQNNLAQAEDHCVVIWGPDLAKFLRRVPDANATPHRKILDLWIMEVSRKSAEFLKTAGFKGQLSEDQWGMAQPQRGNKRGPMIEIPGEWSIPCTGHGLGVGLRGTLVDERRHNRVDDVRLHRKYGHTSITSSTPDNFTWHVDRWHIAPPIRTVRRFRKHSSYPCSPFAKAAGALYPESYFYYMTTKDMKTFHLKKASEDNSLGGGFSAFGDKRDFVFLYYEVLLQNANPFLRWTVLSCWNRFVISLKDFSEDDGHLAGTVLTFGAD